MDFSFFYRHLTDRLNLQIHSVSAQLQHSNTTNNDIIIITECFKPTLKKPCSSISRP